MAYWFLNQSLKIYNLFEGRPIRAADEDRPSAPHHPTVAFDPDDLDDDESSPSLVPPTGSEARIVAVQLEHISKDASYSG